MGKEYEKKSDINEYYNWQNKVINECYRVLKDDGHICWQVGNILIKNILKATKKGNYLAIQKAKIHQMFGIFQM
ncbi:MAG: DNA methyltransferase [Candidatus Tisiphia sp.]